ncbi:MAG: thioredoxin family protein [Puniceicoccales bacterium]|jgi:thiol:disulfide interchange protein DsbD|nr:thioredoxin family protein [Puniceicoccales bacterium]
MFRFLSRFFGFFFLFLTVAAALRSGGDSDVGNVAVTDAAKAAHTSISLLADHSTVAPGQTLLLGLRVVSQKGWHVYSKDPGETGYPPTIEWETLSGCKTGEWLWPQSKPFFQNGIRANVHEGDTVILIPLTIAAGASEGGEVAISGKVSWLECDDRSCSPRQMKVQITFPVRKVPAPAAEHAAVFARAHAAINRAATPVTPATPETSAAQSAGLHWENWTLDRQHALLEAGRIVYVDFTARWCMTCQVNKRVYGDAAISAAFIRENVALLRADWTNLNPDIAAELARNKRVAIPYNAFLRNSRPPIVLGEWLTAANVLAGLDEALGKTSVAAPVPAATTNSLSPAQIAFAFLGGFLLNLMPCVFPVLGLKIAGFAARSGESKRRVVSHALVYVAGILLSFWVLAGILLIARRGGALLGWGFQLQEPVFVLSLAVLFLVLALNMAGVFEIGGRITSAGSALADQSGLRGSFFSGVLATIAATPCAAPFLGGALGVAVTLSDARAFVLFTTVALGLAFPFLLLALSPNLTRLLPRPGAWMESLKQGLSFLLFATVLYWLWVLAAQVTPPTASLQIFLGMALIAFSCWIYGRWGTPARRLITRRIGVLTAAVIFVSSYAWLVNLAAS